MKNSQTGILSFFVFLFFPTILSAAITLSDFPETPFGCEFELNEIADRIEASGYKVAKKNFSNNKKTAICNFSIEIDPSQKYELMDTYGAISRAYGQGWYETLADCEKDLESQLFNFQLYAGLEPFAHYCSSTGSKYSDLKYWPRIIAFGKAELTLKYTNITFSSTWKMDAEDTISQIKSRLNQNDKRLTFIRYKNNKLVLAYYSASFDSIQMRTLVKFETMENCSEALKITTPVYEKQAPKVFALQCVSDTTKKTGANISLLSISLGPSPLTLYSFSGYYPALNDCKNALEKNMELLKKSGDNPLASFCTGQKSRFLAYFVCPDET